MKILGIDPGLRHTGLAVLVDGKITHHSTLVPPGKGKLQPEEVLNFILPPIGTLLKAETFDRAVVEQVTWYGSTKRITLPLSHVAGGIAGFILGRGIPVYLLLANMKTAKTRVGKDWTEHEKDAAMLAMVAYRYIQAFLKGDEKYMKSHKALPKRFIHAP